MVLDKVDRAYWAVVVGAGGLAEAIIERLVLMKFKVVILCRSAYRSEGLRRRIETNTNQPNATIRFVEMDLGELSSIRRAVSEVLDMNIMLKLLVNAAGICAPGKHLKSAEGLDLAYAVDFVGPVLLMQLLHPLLRKNAPSTVVNVTCEEYSQCKCLDLPYMSRMEFEARKAGRLRVLIEYARDVPSANTQGYPSSFIKALIAGQEQSTDIKKGTVNPIFNQRMEFLLANHDQSDVDREFLTLELYQPGAQKEDPDKLLGKARVPLSGLVGKVDSLDSTFSGVFTFQLESAQAAQTSVGRDRMALKVLELEEAIMTGKGNGDFQNLDIIKDHAADREFKIADVMEGMEANLFVQTDEASKLVIFTVSKKLNWFKTSRTRKQFPFDQIWMIEDDAKNDCKAYIKFVKDDLYVHDALVAVGGQRDYALTFPSPDIRELFCHILNHFISSSIKYKSGKLSWKVFKRLNALATGTRELVLDLNARKMYNIDDEKVASGKKVGHGKNTQQIAELELGRGTLHDHEVRKVFNFRDITSIQDVPQALNKVKILFVGGQREYMIEFMTTKQRFAFTKILNVFIYRPPLDAKVKVKVDYTRPQSRTNPYNHEVMVTTKIPTTDHSQASWIDAANIRIPPAPMWYDLDWDRSRGMTSANLQGVRFKDMDPLMASRHAKMCLVAYTLEAARRSAAIKSKDGVQFHLLDPGLLRTTHYDKAVGLGHARRWMRWKARHLGTDPRKAAGAIDFIVKNRVFQHINGLYVKSVKGKPIIMNLSQDESGKIPPKNADKIQDPVWLKLHGLMSTDSKLRAQHPRLATYDMLAVKHLWDSHVNLTGFDPEDPCHTFFLNNAMKKGGGAGSL